MDGEKQFFKAKNPFGNCWHEIYEAVFCLFTKEIENRIWATRPASVNWISYSSCALQIALKNSKNILMSKEAFDI